MKVNAASRRTTILASMGFFLLFIWCAMPAYSQTSVSTGAIQGVIKDAQGAIVAGATVTLVNTALDVRRVVKSGSNGIYTFPLLQPGSGYRVEVTNPGFQKSVNPGISVRVTEVTTVDVHLVIGSVSQSIVVTAAATPVNTSNSTLGGTLTSNIIENMPLPTRNILDILGTDAGVVSQLTSPAATILQGSEAMFVGGNRATSNDYMINGIDANNFEFHTLATGIVPIPNPDAVQEFRTQTDLYDATSGFSGGGAITVVTRRGTSHYHGTIYEYLRNTDANANDFFLNKAGEPRPIMQQNQFGFSFGGAVPKMGKTYFFFNYEGQRQDNGVTGSASGFLPVLPTTRTAATMAALYDLPTSAIDPVAIKILNAAGPYGGFLFPSGQGAPQGELGTFALSSPAQINSNQYNGRIDRAFRTGGVGNQFSVTYFANPATFTNLGGVYGGSIGQPFDYLLGNDTLSVQDMQTIRPDLLNSINVGFTYNKRDIFAINPLPLTAFGMSRYNSSILKRGPNFSFADQMSCCGQTVEDDQLQRNESVDLRDMLSYSHGPHLFRVGFEVRTQQFNFDAPLDMGTLFFLGGIADGIYGPPADPLKDLSIRDFLVGAPFETINSTGLNVFGYRAHDFAGFVQDDYHVTTRLTLNFGLRWDYLGNITEKHDLISNFDPSLLTPLAAQMGGPQMQNAFVLPSGAPKGFGTPGVSKSTYFNQPMKNFEPRVGFALDVFGNGKLALRGGFGIYYMRIGPFGALQTIGNPPFALSTAVINTTKTKLLANPFPILPLPSEFPIYPQFPQLTSLNADGSPNFTQPELSVIALDRQAKPPYTEQWNLTTEYEFIPGWTLQVGYMGSRGIHLENFPFLNNALLRNANNPGPLGLDTNSAQNREARVPYMGICSQCMLTFKDNAASWYNALIVTAQHQFSHGLFLKAAYTFSKSIDNTFAQAGFEPTIGPNGNQFLPGLNKGLSNFDVPNRLVLTYVYDVPGPKHGWASMVLGHWTWSGITTLQNGFAGEIDQYVGNNSLSGTSGYGVLIPGCSLVSGGSVSDHTGDYLNPACVSTTTTLTSAQTFGPFSPYEGPGNQTYQIDPNNPSAVGNLQGPNTRGAFFGPFQTRWDMALTKTIPISKLGESTNLQFRVDAFKVFNTPIFSSPSATAGLSSFGKITSTIDGTGRQLQFALRLNW